ncbi:MAG: tautomerase PptA [Prevotella sp.]|nr:tautomerase PptA [Prevotella sp.]
MPHFTIKCYPKHLTEKEFDAFITDLTSLAKKHLKAGDDDISIDYTEIPAEKWKEVYDQEIKPNMAHLAKKPGYQM